MFFDYRKFTQTAAAVNTLRVIGIRLFDDASATSAFCRDDRIFVLIYNRGFQLVALLIDYEAETFSLAPEQPPLVLRQNCIWGA